MEKLKTIGGEALMEQPLQPQNFMVDTLLSQGLHILAGSPKVGKSWLALWLAVTVAKEEFRSLMENEGYQLRWTDTRKNITYTTPDGKRCRDDRLHDEKYLKENMEYEFTIRQEIIDRRVESVEPDGRKRRRFLDDEYADRDQGGVHHLPGTGGGTDRADGADGQRAAGDRGEAGQAVHRGGTEEGPSTAGPDRHSDRTGWEKERAALFSAPVQSPGVQSHVAVGHSGGGGPTGGVLHAVAELGHSVEVLSEPDPVMDATTAPAHIDKKRWSELQEKRIAAGHKPDDHEEQQNYAFIDKAKRYTVIEELTPELVRLFIQRIEVGERSQRYSRHAAQSIRIIYRDIGDVDSAMEPGEKEPNMIPPLDATTDIPA